MDCQCSKMFLIKWLLFYHIMWYLLIFLLFNYFVYIFLHLCAVSFNFFILFITILIWHCFYFYIIFCILYIWSVIFSSFFSLLMMKIIFTRFIFPATKMRHYFPNNLWVYSLRWKLKVIYVKRTFKLYMWSGILTPFCYCKWWWFWSLTFE